MFVDDVEAVLVVFIKIDRASNCFESLEWMSVSRVTNSFSKTGLF